MGLHSELFGVFLKGGTDVTAGNWAEEVPSTLSTSPVSSRGEGSNKTSAMGPCRPVRELGLVTRPK